MTRSLFSEIIGPLEAVNRCWIGREITAGLRTLKCEYLGTHERCGPSSCISSSGSRFDSDRSQFDSHPVHDSRRLLRIEESSMESNSRIDFERTEHSIGVASEPSAVAAAVHEIHHSNQRSTEDRPIHPNG